MTSRITHHDFHNVRSPQDINPDLLDLEVEEIFENEIFYIDRNSSNIEFYVTQEEDSLELIINCSLDLPSEDDNILNTLDFNCNWVSFSISQSDSSNPFNLYQLLEQRYRLDITNYHLVSEFDCD